MPEDFVQPYPQPIISLSRELDVLPLTAALLANRGYKDAASAKNFLHPQLEYIPDPFLLPDMDRAVEIVSQSIIEKKKIAIYGDYDVDGLSGTAILVRFMKEMGLDTLFYIPHRLEEGYGLHAAPIKKLRNEGAELLITVDTGATGMAEIEMAKNLGMEVVVTDHHHMENPPTADVCVVNPARPDSKFPEKYLAGAAVAFLFVAALRQRLREKNALPKKEPHLGRLINLAALGVIADIVPLIGTNRVLAKFGLKGLGSAHQPGLRELVRACGVEGNMREIYVSFRLAPRLNAAGRMGETGAALELLLTEDKQRATALAGYLTELNIQRQREEEKLFNSIMDVAAGKEKDGAIVVWGENWHLGVIGIVASKLVNKFETPSVVISMNGETGRGSIRGPSGGNLMPALIKAGGHLENYGGHAEAAGFVVKRPRLESFSKTFAEACSRLPSVQKQSLAEAQASPGELNIRFAKELSLMCPFGSYNPEPSLLIKRHLLDAKVVADKHLKIWFDEMGIKQCAIAFNMANKINSLPKELSFVGTPRPDCYNGNVKLEIIINKFL